MKHVAIDFDGVIHSYVTPWTNINEVNDAPVCGIFEMLKIYIEADFKISIFSTRNFQDGGIIAMKAWFLKNGFGEDLLSKLDFPIIKLQTIGLFIDDRAFQFNGTLPSVEYVKNFKPWYKRNTV